MGLREARNAGGRGSKKSSSRVRKGFKRGRNAQTSLRLRRSKGSGQGLASKDKGREDRKEAKERRATVETCAYKAVPNL
eukprot:6176091-Pleurochrysis_carterae.AAC.2